MRRAGVIKPSRVIFVLILAVAVFMFMHSAFFAVTKIKVQGAKQLKNEDIRKISGLNPGLNIFKANLIEAEKKIGLQPLIKNVEIKRQLPSTLVITVAEREALGLVSEKGDFIEVDGDGVFLTKAGNMGKVNLPIITGVPVNKTAPGDKLDSDEMRAALVYLKSMSLKVSATVSEINVRDTNNIKVYTIDGAEIRVGDTYGVTDKLRLYEEVAGRKYDQPIQYIDISYNGPPVIKFSDTKSKKTNTRQ